MKILVSEKFRNLYPLISVFLILVIGFANINNDLNVVLFYIGLGISVGLVLIYALNFRAIKKQMVDFNYCTSDYTNSCFYIFLIL